MFRIGDVPPSFLYDLNPNEKPAELEPVSVNYAAVGFGIFKVPSATALGIENLILSSGPSASHGHPDKLHLDLFAFDDILMPSPGINFPYANNPLLPNWYETTVAHNTLVVDQAVQEAHQHNRYKPDVRADQTVYGPAATMGVQRAWTDTAYPGVRMDRAVFLNGWYLADLFSAVSDHPHTYDLAWHIRGAPTSDLALAPGAVPRSGSGRLQSAFERAPVAADEQRLDAHVDPQGPSIATAGGGRGAHARHRGRRRRLRRPDLRRS